MRAQVPVCRLTKLLKCAIKVNSAHIAQPEMQFDKLKELV